MKHCPLHHVTYVPAKFEVDKKMHYQENTLFDLQAGQGHTNYAQYPLHHVTDAPAKFDAATSHG